jgi:hypothetical protein
MTRLVVVLAVGALWSGCDACPDIPLPPAIQITLLDAASDAPVTDASIRCVRDLRDFPDPAATHPNGVYTCGPLPGTYDVTVTWRGRMVAQRIVDVAASSDDRGRCVTPPPVVALTLRVDAPPGTADAGTGDAAP